MPLLQLILLSVSMLASPASHSHFMFYRRCKLLLNRHLVRYHSLLNLMDAITTGGGFVINWELTSLLCMTQELSSGASCPPLDIHPLESGVVALLA